MGRTYANLSMSLDGYVAGPNVRLDNGMGDGGEALHDWMFAKEGGWAAVEQQLAETGAFVMGRTMLDVGLEPWGDEPPFHAPVFVVTHRAAAPIHKAGGTTFTFVTEGPGVAMDLARAAAGDKDIRVEGGGEIVRECLRAGLVDELRLHIVPILLGGGTPLFTGPEDRAIDLAADGTIDEFGVTHLRLATKTRQAAGTASP